jgi:purine catabolism regulator
MNTLPDGQVSYFAVREILTLPQLAGARLLTSDTSAATDRLVRSTSVQELPFEDFVRQDELVMTTGIGLDSDDELFGRVVLDVARAQAACLAVAVGPRLRTVPASVVKVAEEASLSIIQLPWELRFSEVTELVLGHVLNKQNDLVRRSEQAQAQLTELILGGGGIDRVCSTVAELLELSVSIVNRWGETVTSSPGSREMQFPEIAGPCTVSIAAGGIELGTLFLHAPDGRISEFQLRVARHAATAVAIIMMMERAVVEAEVRGQREFVTSVLHGMPESAQVIEKRARIFGIAANRPYSVAYLLFESGGDPDRPDSEEVGRWALDRVLAVRRIPALTTWYGSEAAVLIPVSTIPVHEQMRCVLDDLMIVLRRQAPNSVVSCGIGSEAAGLAAVSPSFREAVAACRLGHSLNGPGSLTQHQDLGAYPALLEALAGPNSASAFRHLNERYLGPVIEYEHRSGLPLIETLTSLFGNNGNVSATARELGINRQSLLYRLEKIESLVGVDLATSSSRFAIELALRALDVQAISAFDQ